MKDASSMDNLAHRLYNIHMHCPLLGEIVIDTTVMLTLS